MKHLGIKPISFIMLAGLIFASCMREGPVPIDYNKDACDNCKMSISDKRFACELVTSKGKVYKFDDVICMLSYAHANKDKMKDADFHVNDYLEPNQLQLTDKLFFVKAESIGSPMGGNTAAFLNKDSSAHYVEFWRGKLAKWDTLFMEE